MSTVAGVTAAPRPSRLPLAIPLTIAAAWAVVLAAQASGGASFLHHHEVAHDFTPARALLFLLAWQVMVAAMMLPSALPLVALFAAAAGRQERPRRVMTAFVGGYVLIWGLFGAVALFGDVALHGLEERWPFLEERPWLIGGTALALAGAFQFTALKDRCLHVCRHPAVYLRRHYRRGTLEAFRIGRDHGAFCLGCCWALMLLMFAAGLANLAWMAVLTAAMVYEKVSRRGRRLTPVIGVVLLVWAALVLAHPGWLPEPFAAAA